MKQGRRDFLRQSALATAGAVSLGLTPSASGEDFLPKRRPNPIGVSTYSFWRFNGPREDYPIEQCIDRGRGAGFC